MAKVNKIATVATKVTGVKSIAVATARAAKLQGKVVTDSPAIKVLTTTNPYRAGSYRATAWAAVLTCKTVADYMATGHKPKYLNKWVGEKAIAIA